MNWPLNDRLHAAPNAPSDEILNLFLGYVSEKQIELYPAQEEAILELFQNKNVILNTPTGSGKSLVAAALHFLSCAQNKVSYYTSPIKALVNEKFLNLCQEFGPQNVGMMTGDATVNPKAPILCCTAEILSNLAMRLGENTPIDDVVVDEFHYYSDRQRGVHWQIPLLTLKKTRFLLMSATLGDVSLFERSLTQLNTKETILVRSNDRPVPLHFEYKETLLHETVKDLVGTQRAPVYVVNFTQREAAETTQDLMSQDFASKEEKLKILDFLKHTKFTSPYGKEIQKFLKHGIGIHHAGLLPKYRVLVEQMAQRGLLKIICGTDTLGVGVNIPLRSVLFTRLCKFDGEKTALLTSRDFHQISGRAGRKGFDDQGYVIAQAPEHVVENLRMEQKAAGDNKKLRKMVKKKPPERGFVSWDKATFERLRLSLPEPLQSRFAVNHGILLNVLSRGPTGCVSMRELIRFSHETESQKKSHRANAFLLFRTLIDRKIIEFDPIQKLKINLDLQKDFSLHHTLSLYLIDTIEKLDFTAPEYSLQLLTLVESIVEDPDVILRKQLDRAKDEKMSEMKMSGVEYEERMIELEKVEYPKPHADFVYSTFNEFASIHPWVKTENIRPKSIAREMFEVYSSFSDYIRDYDLKRSEGVLLRYLSEVYKVLLQTVPQRAKTQEIEEMVLYFESLVRSTDSSLLEEWEKMKNPSSWTFEGQTQKDQERPVEQIPVNPLLDYRRNPKPLQIAVKNEVFRVVRAISVHDIDALLETLTPLPEAVAAEIPARFNQALKPWTRDTFDSHVKQYFSDHHRIRTDTTARQTHFQKFDFTPTDFPKNRFWLVEQTLVDADDSNDWSLSFSLDLFETENSGRPVLYLLRFGPTDTLAEP